MVHVSVDVSLARSHLERVWRRLAYTRPSGRLSLGNISGQAVEALALETHTDIRPEYQFRRLGAMNPLDSVACYTFSERGLLWWWFVGRLWQWW